MNMYKQFGTALDFINEKDFNKVMKTLGVLSMDTIPFIKVSDITPHYPAPIARRIMSVLKAAGNFTDIKMAEFYAADMETKFVLLPGILEARVNDVLKDHKFATVSLINCMCCVGASGHEFTFFTAGRTGNGIFWQGGTPVAGVIRDYLAPVVNSERIWGTDMQHWVFPGIKDRGHFLSMCNWGIVPGDVSDIFESCRVRLIKYNDWRNFAIANDEFCPWDEKDVTFCERYCKACGMNIK